METCTFRSARPVWIRNKETEMNCALLLRAVLPQNTPAGLAIAAHGRYQIFINGAFFAEGPARAAHGFYRVSEYDLQSRLDRARNVVAILAVGYNVNSFSVLDAPSFVCAEITADGETLAATGAEPGFEAAEEQHRVKKTPRFSFQRPATEAYVYDAFWDLPRVDPDAAPVFCDLAETEPKTFIAREVPYCEYEERKVKKILRRGVLAPETDKKRRENHRVHAPDENAKGWPLDALEAFPTREVLGYMPVPAETEPTPAEPVKLGTNCFCVYDMEINTSGFLRIDLVAEHDIVLYAVFSDKLNDRGVPQPGADNCQNCVKWALQGGRAYELVSFAPYTFRYLELISMYAPVLITGVSQYTESYPKTLIKPAPQLPDDDLRLIYDAAVETFRQNATDIFMDCPSRERAGWLCDSFFTSRTEYALTGSSIVERAFLDNFLMPERYPDVPAGMLPMCYPSDHPGGGYIPNWAMWYLLELAEYRDRSGDAALIAKAREKMYALADFFTAFENGDGLLQKLESWVFVEWSKANDYVQDINYPTNMLYAKFLETLGGLYGDEALKAKARRLKETIREKAFDGTFFLDNAIIENGAPVPTKNHTETAQYYAFFTGVATPETDPALYRRLLDEFGPERDPGKEYPDVPVSNAFIGNYLRLEILFRNGEYDRLLKEIKAFFLPMAQKTGTLWENMTDFASCCHGFASHVACWLRAICG